MRAGGGGCSGPRRATTEYLCRARQMIKHGNLGFVQTGSSALIVEDLLCLGLEQSSNTRLRQFGDVGACHG